MKEFNKTGLYLFKVKFDLEDDEIYWDKEYEFDIYYFKTKKLYEENKYSKHKEYFVESTKGLLPKDLKNAKFMDYESTFEFDNEDFLDFKSKSLNPNKFYCIVISTGHIDDLVFTDKNYSQKVFEFDSEKDIKEFIKNGKETGKLVSDNRTKIVIDNNNSNITYLISSKNKTKEVKKEYFLKEEDLVNKELTKIIFYPSLDTYLFTCHEDYIREVVDNLSKFSLEEINIDKFIKEVKSFAFDVKDFSCKYIGKTTNLNADDPHSTYDESVYVINTYIKLDYIYTNEELNAIKNLIENEELLFIIKNSVEKDDFDNIKDTLQNIKFADYHSNKEKDKTIIKKEKVKKRLIISLFYYSPLFIYRLIKKNKYNNKYTKIYKEVNMSKYYDNLNDEVKKYFNILSPIFPNWLLEYIDNPEMERINKISMSCGTDYSKCFNVKYWYSNLDHSVAVALIIWNFTHDKKQTLAGLFHDIATPAFKHCIDFMNGDSETQESTEEFTTSMIMNSPKIMYLLKKDNIKLEDVIDYKIYPIADNELPKLSADRFEYTFSSGLTFFRVWDLEKVKKMYNNIVIVKNEEGLDEFAFKDKDIAEEYIDTISKLWPEWIKDENRTVMQFLADICMSMKNAHYLNLNDLYSLSEKEIIDKILNCDDTYLSESFKKFLDTDKVYKSDYPVENKYSVNVKSKTRYIIPLVQTEGGPKRITEISEKANKQINDFLNAPKGGYYTYFDFDFIPYYDEIKTKKYIKKPNRY